MIQIHKSKSPCPTALAKGKSKCLGVGCPWFIKNDETGIEDCVVAVQGRSIISMIDEIEELKQTVKDILAFVESAGPALDANLTALEELKEMAHV